MGESRSRSRMPAVQDCAQGGDREWHNEIGHHSGEQPRVDRRSADHVVLICGREQDADAERDKKVRSQHARLDSTAAARQQFMRPAIGNRSGFYWHAAFRLLSRGNAGALLRGERTCTS